MPKKLFKRFSPDSEYLKSHPSMNRIAHLLDDPYLFHFNRHSVPLAFLIGVFCAFFPIPFQMVLAAVLALWVRCNLPIAVALVWITNPLTLLPIYYSTYQLGAWLLEVPTLKMPDEASWAFLSQVLPGIWKPFIVGCLTAGTFFALASFFLVKGFWRFWVIRSWQRRKLKREKLRNKAKRKPQQSGYSQSSP